MKAALLILDFGDTLFIALFVLIGLGLLRSGAMAIVQAVLIVRQAKKDYRRWRYGGMIAITVFLLTVSASAAPRRHRKPRPVQIYVFRSQDRDCSAYKSGSDVPQSRTITVAVPKRKRASTPKR